MSEKRALIVDDSKSARVVLSRLLERHDLAVDTSDSAEHALEYLKAHRPDVIFMDHMMPGMDGLAAVRAIRGNPDTATIPIMMYTSQEGEVYLGQARAHGATGVLPKRIGTTEVSQILQDLQLVPSPAARAESGAADGRPQLSGPIIVPAPAANAVAATESGAPEAPVPASQVPQADAPANPPPALSPDELRVVLEPMLKQHSAELRRFVVASLESFAARVVIETRELARAAAAGAPVPVAVPTPVAAAPVHVPAPAAPPPASRPTGWIVATALASLAAVAAAAFAWQAQRRLEAVIERLDAPAVSASASSASAAHPRDAAATAARPPGAKTVPPLVAESLDVLPVPYGEPPLAGPRLARLATILGELERRGARGVVTITLHGGEYCLTGNPAEGYALAPDEMSADRCDLVGNPRADRLRPAQREPAAYAELVAATRARSGGALDVRVVDAGRRTAATSYPEPSSATAAQWNAAAAANQRIEIALLPPKRS